MINPSNDPCLLLLRSLLFVPGNRPDRFGKALASGADLVCIDLEDAVSPAAKESARESSLTAVLDNGAFALRINSVRSKAGLSDLLAIADRQVRPSAIILPMVEAETEISIVCEVLGEPSLRIIPLIETVRGLRNAHAIAGASNVAALMFGGGDYAAQLGVPMSWEALLMARMQIIQACAECGKSAIDVPFVALDDVAGLEEECRRIKVMGFAAKAAIHPAQIAAIHRIFQPNAAEIEEAVAAIAAFEKAGGAAAQFQGRLLEAPLMARYRKVLELRDLQARLLAGD